MSLDDIGMHRAGLAFVYRTVPILVATILFGIYLCLLCIATRGLLQREFKNRSNIVILLVLYGLFFMTSALWALEVAQLMGLDELLLHPNDLSTNDQFNIFYALIARETKATSIIFQCQMILGDILVIWRSYAIWHDQKRLVFVPLFWWTMMIINMAVCAGFCRSGVSSTNYTILCKSTDILAPVLSILTNVSVMVLTLWKAWRLREVLMEAFHGRKKNKIFTLFVLLIESGTLYVIMLITDLLVTSLVTGGNESIGRMIDCISGYSTVQFVAIYPTLMLVVLRESVWNSSDDSTSGVMDVSTLKFGSVVVPRRSGTHTTIGFVEHGHGLSPGKHGGPRFVSMEDEE